MSDGDHIIVDTLAGHATLTAHKAVHLPGRGLVCIPLASVILDPPQVLALATKLTVAAIPDPPVIRRRITVRRRGAHLWGFDCPECLPIRAAWHTQSAAHAAARRHLAVDHTGDNTAEGLGWP